MCEVSPGGILLMAASRIRFIQRGISLPKTEEELTLDPQEVAGLFLSLEDVHDAIKGAIKRLGVVNDEDDEDTEYVESVNTEADF